MQYSGPASYESVEIASIHFDNEVHRRRIKSVGAGDQQSPSERMRSGQDDAKRLECPLSGVLTTAAFGQILTSRPLARIARKRS